MLIIPVLDVTRGVAVHAIAGNRARYAPVRSVLAQDRAGDPLALARAFRGLGAPACYVADLDGIAGGAVQVELIHRLAGAGQGFGGPLFVDAGVSNPDRAAELLRCGAARVVVGLETLRSFADFGAIVDAVGPRRVIFSLDLRLGAPIVHPALHDVGRVAPDAAALAERAVAEGARSVLVLDVGRAGTGVGVDLGLVELLRRRLPDVELLAGGGVLERRDLDRLAVAGCDGALVASALHAGRITADEVGDLSLRRQSETSGRR
jgi:phosphoribosylformimino-5-aminoimidazole carboxamide ribotide isomerase